MSERHLTTSQKIVYAVGDHTVNLSLSAISLFYVYFLTHVAGLRPALAGSVLLLGRVVDAFTDPAMGRISDLTRTRFGRRRPYFLLGMLPFGICFALLWAALPAESQTAKFLYYTTVYIGLSVSTTVLSVPYLALIPEMATGYHERTNVNTYRSAGAVLGTIAAIGVPMLADRFGGGPRAFAEAGALVAVWLAVPWIPVFLVSFERPGYQRAGSIGLAEGLRKIARHSTFRILVGFYLAARVAVDLIGFILIFYFTHWLGRREDLYVTLPIMLGTVVVSLPFWLRVARRVDKRTIFLFGACWWIAAQGFFLLIMPDWPRWQVFALGAVTGIGYAVADLMPWSMLGDVIDEDELATGERREGVYAGFFTFLRKLGGASGVWLATLVLDFAGFQGEEPVTETVVQTIRWLTALAPALFLAIAVGVAWNYPLSRERHAQIVAALVERRASRGP